MDANLTMFSPLIVADVFAVTVVIVITIISNQLGIAIIRQVTGAPVEIITWVHFVTVWSTSWDTEYSTKFQKDLFFTNKNR